MKQCPRCANQIEDVAPWCPYCGQPFTAYPPQYQQPPSQQIIQYNDPNSQSTDNQQSQPWSQYPPQQPYYPPQQPYYPPQPQYPAAVSPQYYPSQYPVQLPYYQAPNYFDPYQLAAKGKISEIINLYISEGYRVISQTDDSAQLLKPKKFSGCLAIFLFLFFTLPFVIYLLVYLAMKDKQIYIQAQPDGNIRISDEQGRSKIYTGDSPWIVDREIDPALGAAIVTIIIVFLILLIILT